MLLISGLPLAVKNLNSLSPHSPVREMKREKLCWSSFLAGVRLERSWKISSSRFLSFSWTICIKGYSWTREWYRFRIFFSFYRCKNNLSWLSSISKRFKNNSLTTQQNTVPLLLLTNFWPNHQPSKNNNYQIPATFFRLFKRTPSLIFWTILNSK